MTNLAASVRVRLLNLSRSEGVPFNSLMERYATGRFLYRLAESPYREHFVLKGAQLFRIWEAEEHRPTRDLDLLGYGEATEEAIKGIFTELTETSVTPEDGLEWSTVTTAPIRNDVSYGGVRASLTVHLAGARLSIQIDVGFGDAITPGIVEKEWHELLSFPSARLLTYPPETVIAEKLQAAVSLGINNSRMKDFYDLHWLLTNFSFQGDVLTEAVSQTFSRRETEFPQQTPIVFTSEFHHDSAKVQQWDAFLRKGQLQKMGLSSVLKDISDFLLPVLEKKVTDEIWTPEAHWQPNATSS